MKKETLNSLPTGYNEVFCVSHLNKLNHKARKRAYGFISCLIEAKIPLEQIMTNSWLDCPEPKVFISLPYGSKNGHQVKEYKRFSKHDLTNAINWHKNNK